MRFVARVLFSCIEGWFKEKRPETDLIESVSGCKSTLNSVFLFSDTAVSYTHLTLPTIYSV